MTPKTQQWIDGEFQYYGIKEKDTILDFSTNQSLTVPIIASSVNHLHFYLGEIKINGINYTHSKWTEQRVTKLKKEYLTTNDVTFEKVENISDSFYLPSCSVNKVICRYLIYNYDLEKISKEFLRVLKPNGELIFIKRTVEDTIFSKETLNAVTSNPLPNKKSYVEFFETNGFSLVSDRNVLYNEQVLNSHSTKFKNVKELLLVFRKKR